jgi:phospholipid/cholesterol/gamma-HCH transport system substrate-binding protein
VSRVLRIGAVVVVLALLVVGLLKVLGGSDTKKLTAYFPRATGLYAEASVRILGVPIGSITKITPMGDRVKVEMTYDAKYKLPADAAAILVPPSIVSDRYVQIAPVYDSGPALPDNATIPIERTEVPIELDDIFGDIDTLMKALGPEGANKDGSFSRLIDVSAQNLRGNGAQLNATLRDFSKAIGTLSAGREDLFGTVSSLQRFTTALANDDAGVRRVNDDLAEVSVQLAGERQELAAALRNLAVGLGQVASFVRDNRTALTADIKALTTTTSTVVKEKRALMEFLDLAPVALENLALSYDNETRTLRTRSNNENGSDPSDPTNPICQLFTLLGQPCPGAAAALNGPLQLPKSSTDKPSVGGLPLIGTPISGLSGADALVALLGVAQ